MKMRSLIFLLIIFLFSPKVVFAQNLLQNPGFEELLFNWEVSPGLNIVFNFTISSYAKKSGDYSALVKHNKTGSYGARQVIRNIVGGSQYLGKGYVLFNNEDAKNAKIRVAWYSSDDSSGSQMETVDSNIVDTTFPSWQELDTGVINAPSTAKSAEFRILLASNAESYVYFDDLSFEKVNLPTPIPTLIPTSIPSSSPTSNPISILTPTSIPKLPTLTPKSVATYKINEVKDEDGEILSSVKVYVDNIYLHHYAPEVITFCDNCQCDTYVACGFGQHIIKLEKTGYEDWSKTVTINPNTSDQVSPVMVFPQTDSTPTPTKIVSPTVAPTLKINPTITPKPTTKTATDSGEILGVENEVTPAFYPLEETTSSEAAGLATDSGKSKFWPKFFFVVALVFLFFVSFWVWYNFRTRY